jgi:translation initiation factor 3 subunit K
MNNSILALSDPHPHPPPFHPPPTPADHPSYQFNPHLTKDETVTNILVKALTVFPAPDFSLCLSLLAPHVLLNKSGSSTAHSLPAAGDAPLSEAVQKLNDLHNSLARGDYSAFWAAYDGDDLFADLVADVVGFEELMRLRIVVAVGQAWRAVQRSVLQEWLNLEGREFDHLMGVVGFEVQGDVVKIPLNKENAVKSSVLRENVKFDRRSAFTRLLQVLTSHRVFAGHPAGLRAACLSASKRVAKRRNDSCLRLLPA